LFVNDAFFIFAFPFHFHHPSKVKRRIILSTGGRVTGYGGGGGG
jgi:hypothetical protein